MNRVGVLSYNLVKLEEQKDKKNYAAQITPQESVDINYPADFQIAELFLRCS